MGGEDGPPLQREEEKELTPLQLLDHMLEVGKLCLTHPHLMADPEGGRGGLMGGRKRRRGGRWWGWVGWVCCERGRGEVSEALLKGLGEGGEGVKGSAGLRRRGGTSPVVPVAAVPEGAGGGGGGGGRGGGGGASGGERVEGPADAFRFSFHAPPHNSIAHLHLHCFQLPFTHVWHEWSFRANTRWCKEADAIRAQLLRRDTAHS